MAQVTHFFAGANSGQGFQSLFAEVLDLEQAADMMILKGGPGVGKSTFMRTIGTAMEEADTAVEYLHCSGDPDSLDGVVLPELGCGIVDGTAPHMIDPRYPAAVDRCVDLGQFYNLTGTKSVAGELRQLTRQYHNRIQEAFRWLHTARAVEEIRNQAAGEYMDRYRLERRVTGIIGRELRLRGNEAGIIIRRFLGSTTCQGMIWRFDSVDALCSRVYEFADSWDRSGNALAHLASAAHRQSWNIIVCMAPEQPDHIQHLLIPGLGLAFVTSCPEMHYENKPHRRIRVDAMGEPADKDRLKRENQLIRQLRQEGVMELREAGIVHDAMERLLHPFVDFEGVHALAVRETKRLLDHIS